MTWHRSRSGGARFCFCLLATCLAAAQLPPARLAAAQTDQCSVAGTVRDSVTGAPVRKLSVILGPAWGGYTYAAPVNSAGALCFRSVGPGNYRISLQRAGYRSLPGNEAALFHLDPGRPVADLVITAVPLAAISGTVLDADGERMVEAEVGLVRSQWRHGSRVWAHVKMVQTNDLGQYRIDGVEPGDYYIRGNAGPHGFSVSIVSDGPGQPEMAVTPVFYPRAVTIAGASLLHVGAGQEITGIDLRLHMGRTFHIRGTVDPTRKGVSATNPPALPDVVAYRDDGGVKDWPDFFGRIDLDGSFDIPGVPSGNCLVQELNRSGSLSVVGPPDGSCPQREALGFPLTGLVRAKVEFGDVSNLRVATVPFDARIRARFEGDASHDLSKWHALLERADWTEMTMQTWSNSAGVISNVLPGRYLLKVSPNERAYVKKVLMHGREIDGWEVELESAADQLEIVLAKGGRDIRGTFAWPEPRPVNASAILVPEQPRPGNFTTVDRADIDQGGEFTFLSVAPGRYRSFVVTDFDQGLWENRDFFRLVADQGTVVEVPEGETATETTDIKPILLPAAVIERAIARMGN